MWLTLAIDPSPCFLYFLGVVCQIGIVGTPTRLNLVKTRLTSLDRVETSWSHRLGSTRTAATLLGRYSQRSGGGAGTRVWGPVRTEVGKALQTHVGRASTDVGPIVPIRRRLGVYPKKFVRNLKFRL